MTPPPNADREARRRRRLVDRIAHMIGEETYNHAPINYTIAEKAIAMVERSNQRSGGGQIEH